VSAPRSAWLALGAALLLGCPARDGAAPAQQRVASSRERLVAWLECEECGDGELVNVVALGPAVVPTLAAVLRSGMSPAQRAKLTLQLEQRWEERRAYESEHASESRLASREQYVAGHLESRDALYRVRAATALGRIGSDEAIEALRAALSVPQRPSVERAISQALAKP